MSICFSSEFAKPMRVPCKRTSLPQVFEDQCETDGNDSFKLDPLPEMTPETFLGAHFT